MDHILRVEKPWGFEIWCHTPDSRPPTLLHIEGGQGCRVNTTSTRTKAATCFLVACVS